MSKSREIKNRTLDILAARTINGENINEQEKVKVLKDFGSPFTYPERIKLLNNKIITPATVIFDVFEDLFVGGVDIYTARLGRLGSSKIYLFKKTVNVIFGKDNKHVNLILNKYDGDVYEAISDIRELFSSIIEIKAVNEEIDGGGVKIIVGDEIKSTRIFTFKQLRQELIDITNEPIIGICNSDKLIPLSVAEDKAKK